MPNTDSPCIGICSTTYGDQVCRGCKRRYDEVIGWNAMQDEEKLDILQRIDVHTAEVVEQFIEVTDPKQVRRALRKWGIRFRQDDAPLTWALHLLKFADDRIEDINDVGIKVKADYAEYPLRKLANVIDIALYKHACTLFV
jgi:hypothetical protein